MEKKTYPARWARLTLLVIVLALVCMAAVLPGEASAEGYWKLVDTKLVNETVSPFQGGWSIKVLHHRSGLIEYECRYQGGPPEVCRVEWAPPAAHLKPGGPVLVTASATVVTCPPAPNHSVTAKLECSFFSTSGGRISTTAAVEATVPQGGMAPATRSIRKTIEAPDRSVGDANGRMLFPHVSINGSGTLAVNYVYQWVGGSPGPASEPGGSIAGTSWIVGNHPVPWVFEEGGVVGAKGLWSGTWEATGDGIVVTLNHQGVQDRFIVKVSQDGRSFTAYKDGKVYRTGVRSR